MLDINHILSNPGVDIQTFYGDVTTTSGNSWRTWRKPRGVKMVYLIGVGGGGAGYTSNVSGGVGQTGGGSGGQTNVLIPAWFVPDILYIQPGRGGKSVKPAVAATAGVAGLATYVSFEPSSFGQVVLLTAPAPLLGNQQGAVVTTIATMSRAAMGSYQFLAGQATVGNAGVSGTPTSTNGAPPTTGLIVMGGGQGGFGASASNTGGGGGYQQPSNILGNQIWPQTFNGGAAASGSTPGGRGPDGFTITMPNLRGSDGILVPLMNIGGSGGGGGTNTLAGGAGGNGGPGCGGGASGGAATGNSADYQPGGDGGDGFVIIMSW